MMSIYNLVKGEEVTINPGVEFNSLRGKFILDNYTEAKVKKIDYQGRRVFLKPILDFGQLLIEEGKRVIKKWPDNKKGIIVKYDPSSFLGHEKKEELSLSQINWLNGERHEEGTVGNSWGHH